MGSSITDKITQPMGRRDFLKTTGKGIMGAAASQFVPSTGGIMETTAAKEITKNVPFDYLGFGKIVKQNAIDFTKGPSGESVYTAITKDGKRIEFSEPSYESVTRGGTGTTDYGFKVTGNAVGSYTGPDGESEYYDSEIPLYEINYQQQLQDDGGVPGGVDIASDFYYSGDMESPDLEFNSLEQIDNEYEAPRQVAQDLGDLAKNIMSPDMYKEKTKKPETKQIEQSKNLPAKKEFNIKGVVKALAKKYPPVKVINALQLMSQGLDLWEAMNESMGMPSKEEFAQIVKDMESSEYKHGGIATLKV